MKNFNKINSKSQNGCYIVYYMIIWIQLIWLLKSIQQWNIKLIIQFIKKINQNKYYHHNKYSSNKI